MKILRLKNKSGFSTLEIIISLFIFSAVISSVFALIFGNQTSAVNSKIYQDLILFSQLNLEKAKEEAESSKGNFFYEEEKDGIKNSFNISLFYDYTKEIKSEASLSMVKNTRSVEFGTLFSDFEESVGGSTCLRKLSHDVNYEVIKNFPLNADGSPVDIDVARDKAYIALDASAVNFLVVDISDKAEPLLLNSLNTGRRLNSLHVAGGYAFVATNSTSRQIQVLDISDPLNSFVVSEYRLPDPSSTTTASSIFYKNKKIYLGTQKHASGREFHVIDVSDPALPGHLSSWEIDNVVNDIFVKDNFAFLASVNPHPLRVIDLENSGSEVIKIFVDSPGNVNQSGQRISILDNFLILGRSVFQRSPDYSELVVFDINEKENPAIIETFNFSESVRGLIGRENVVSAVTTWGENKKIQIFYPNELYEIGLPDSLNIPAKPVAIDCEDDFLYVVTENPSNLLIIGKNE